MNNDLTSVLTLSLLSMVFDAVDRETQLPWRYDLISVFKNIKELVQVQGFSEIQFG